MNRYIQSATILIAALSVIGCNKVEDFNSNPDNALQIESVGGVSQYALMQSKAVIEGNTLLPGSEAAQGIGIFVTAKDGSAYDGKTSGYSNVKYTYNGEKWSTTTPIYLSNTVGKLYGYFPYNTTATDLTKIPIVSSLNGTDYLYAEQREVSISEKSVSLQMNHALARLHLTLKKGEKYKANGVISGITLKSTAIDATGTMDITTGEVTATKAKTDKGVVQLVASGSLSTGDQTYDILLVPAYASDAATPFDILISIDGATAGVTLSGENGITVQSGKQYDVTLEIQDTGIKVSGVGVGLWGEGGSQQVQVGEHTVTVKLSNEFDGIVKDIIANAYEDNGDVIIKAMSVQKKVLSCNIGGSAQCQRVKDNDIYTFTISNISSNVEAVLGYPIVSISVKSDDSNGKVWIGDDDSKTSGQFEFGQQVVIHALPNDGFRFFRWNDNNRETSRTITVGELEATYSASFISSDLIPGLFTVNSNGKQVFFSNGNLYWDGSKYCFEDNQWEVKDTYDINHISHFTWSSTVAAAVGNKYSGDYLFCDENHKVSVDGSDKIYYALSIVEWDYLFNKRAMNYVDFRYTLNITYGGKQGLVLYPDDYIGKALSGSFETLPEDVVFLPFTGSRNGETINDGGAKGYYVSSSTGTQDNIYRVVLKSDCVDMSQVGRHAGSAVRLVAGY